MDVPSGAPPMPAGVAASPAVRDLLERMGWEPGYRNAITPGEAGRIVDHLLADSTGPDDRRSLLLAMRVRGVIPQELAELASVFRSRCRIIDPSIAELVDVGESYDGHRHTLVLTPAVAAVAAAAGCPVLLHGASDVPPKRGVTTADVLERLGVPVRFRPRSVVPLLKENGIGFLHAADLQPAWTTLIRERREIGRRTVLNSLEQLTNPASARQSVLGAVRGPFVEGLARVLIALRLQRGATVVGEEGSIIGSGRPGSAKATIRAGEMHVSVNPPADPGSALRPSRTSVWTPADLLRATAEAVLGVLTGDADAQIRTSVLEGAAVLLEVSEHVPTHEAALRQAAEALDSRAAWKRWSRFVEMAHDSSRDADARFPAVPPAG